MTRAVWIAFAFSAMVLGFRRIKRRVLAACALLAVASLLAVVAVSFNDHALKTALESARKNVVRWRRVWRCMTRAGRCFRNGR